MNEKKPREDIRTCKPNWGVISHVEKEKDLDEVPADALMSCWGWEWKASSILQVDSVIV